MKKLILVGALIASVFSVSAQTAGKIFSGPDAGKGFQLGSEKSSQVILDMVKAYNTNEAEKELSFYSAEMQKKFGESITKYHQYAKTLNNQVYAIFPIKITGSNDEIVMLQSTDERVAKDGSKQKMNMFELFKLDKNGKIADFNRYTSIPASNEYGKTEGGKFYSKGETNGRPFQFSNRGEVAAIENLNKAYNAMDLKTVASFFADKINITDFDGNKIVLENKDLHLLMDPYSSLDWKIWGILPFKIAETDPVSGIMVSATEKRVLKDGSVWNKSLVEFFTFDLNGKISVVNQFLQGAK